MIGWRAESGMRCRGGIGLDTGAACARVATVLWFLAVPLATKAWPLWLCPQVQQQQNQQQRGQSPEASSQSSPQTSQQAAPVVLQPRTAGRGQRLIMKDGTDQLVSSYQVKGDEVRFYSVERSEWEEIPAAMVDWDATKKFEAERAKKEAAQVSAVQKIDAQWKADPIDVDASIELGPAIFLPPGQGLFVFDGKAVLPIQQAHTTEKLDKKRLLEQIVVPMPVVPSKHNIVLPGRAAKMRIGTTEPEFYYRTTEAAEPQFDLVQAKVKGDERIIASRSTIATINATSAQKEIPFDVARVAPGLYRMTINQAMAPGEYAITQQLGTDEKTMNVLVWDFGINPGTTSDKTK
jgi:hypothetical protein